jgi:hypothetical protein
MDAIAEDAAVESYRLISIDRTAAPRSAAGDDWLVYQIAMAVSIARLEGQGCVDHRLLAERVERSNLGNPLDAPFLGRLAVLDPIGRLDVALGVSRRQAGDRSRRDAAHRLRSWRR